MSVILDIPEGVMNALPSGAAEQRRFLMLELACALYAKETISLAQGAEMTGLSRLDFGWEVGERGIPRHYGAEELAEDLAYADRF